MRSVVLKNGRIVTPEATKRLDLLIKGMRINRIGSNLQGDEVIDCEGCYILPGFRDQHIHDLNGFMKYRCDQERFKVVSKSLATQGVTGYLLTTMAAPVGELVEYLRAIGKYSSSNSNGVDGARLEGANVEGTFIRRECAGAQPLEYIVQPNEPEAYKVLCDLLGTGAIRLINIIPDFGTELIQYASSHSVIVGCGHSIATAEQLEQGFKQGLHFIVHLTNGSMGRSFKPFSGGGTYEGALVLPLFVELIVDGYHVNPKYVSDIIWHRLERRRGHEIIAVTDGIFPVLREIPEGQFRMYSTSCRKSQDGEVFVVECRVDADGVVLPVPENTLCSSKLTMDKAFENLLNLLTRDMQGFMIDREALSLEDALPYVSRFTSTNQAMMQRVDHETGTIDAGKLADLTVLRVTGEEGMFKVEIQNTIVAGNV
jgi:N-acetylglucosamine-6-phosphate deacetylase